MCLNELQSIIDVRAAERQERERVALTRMKLASAETDHHLPVGEACERETDHGGVQEFDHGVKEDLEQGIVDGGFGEDPEECVDDRAKDIEDRVEYWKQFDQREHSATVSEEKNDRRDDDSNGDTDERRIIRSEAHKSETRNTPCQATASTLQESGFVFLTDRDSEADPLESVLNQSASGGEAEDGDIQRLSEASQKVQTTIDGRTKDTNAQRLSTDPSPDGSCFVASNTNSDGEESEGDNRPAPEGVEEHLSLAAAPSPFAFSIASMVASRARNFAQAEDTFGDSSSDEEGEEEGKVGEDETPNESLTRK